LDRASGQHVVNQLIGVLERGADAVKVPPSEFGEHIDRAMNVTVMCAHALGQLADCMPPNIATRAASALAAAMTQATREIDRRVQTLPTQQREAYAVHLGSEYQSEVAIEFDVLERRRLLAEGSVALSQIGQRAALRGDVAVSTLVLDSLLAVVTQGSCDPGADTFPAFIRPQTAQHNAATALVRLCSHPATSAPDVPRKHGVPLREGGNLRSLMEVARRRLAAVLQEGGGATAAHVAMEARLSPAFGNLDWGIRRGV
jgi:hypothetical protein